MICPACGTENLPGVDSCAACQLDFMHEDGPQPDTPIRWRVMVDEIASLDPSTIAPQTIARGASLADAVAQMQARNVGYLLVTGTEGELVGILTEHDLLLRVVGLVEDLGAETVDRFMDARPTALHASQPIAHALYAMAVNDFMYIPLVDDAGRPTDLLSFRRIARLMEQME